MKNSFLEILQSEGKKDYFQNILVSLKESEKNGPIYPHQTNIFRPFEFFQVNETKVVILGQDPYHGYDQADGLAFSSKNPKTPPSLRNIFKELKKEYPKTKIETNDLSAWAKQGVLLLNTILTVNYNMPLSHKHFGWETFTKEVLKQVALQAPKAIFVLLGKHAQKFAQDLNLDPIRVIATSHPSPYSYKKGFENSGIFKLINKKLKQNGLEPIKWDLKKESK